MFGRVSEPCAGSFSRREQQSREHHGRPDGLSTRGRPPRRSRRGDLLWSGGRPATPDRSRTATGCRSSAPAALLTQARPELLPLLLVLLPGGALPLRRAPADRPRRRLAGRADAVVPARRARDDRVATLSGLAAYDESLFAVHMVQHMLLSMVATVFLALGAPITLALRIAARPARAGPCSRCCTRACPLRQLPRHPVGALRRRARFALYFSGWYEATLDNRALHELLHLHFWSPARCSSGRCSASTRCRRAAGHPFRLLPGRHDAAASTPSSACRS
jgi:hypothetical protein